MARKTLKTGWEKQTDDRWVYSLGSKGARIRLFQKRTGGTFYLDRSLTGEKQYKVCIHTADKAEAERIGHEALALLHKGTIPGKTDVVSINLLCTLYRTHSTAFKAQKPDVQKDTEARMKILTGHFGRDFDVRQISGDVLKGYRNAREAGGIDMGDGRITKAVTTRSVQQDYKLLHAMLRWAIGYVLKNDRTLLARDPMFDFKMPKARKPRGAVATDERYVRTRAAIQDKFSNATCEASEMKWRRLELALVLVRFTGRRIGAVRHLRWDDIDIHEGVIHWRAEHDKINEDWEVDVADGLKKELEWFFIHLDGAKGGLVFPRFENPHLPIRSEKLDDALLEAEAHASLSKLDGTLWHAYRRAWATGMKDAPVVDAMYAGGWKDARTFLHYQKPTREAVRAVVNSLKPVSGVLSVRN